jgi:hypothetical protein
MENDKSSYVSKVLVRRKKTLFYLLGIIIVLIVLVFFNINKPNRVNVTGSDVNRYEYFKQVSLHQSGNQYGNFIKLYSIYVKDFVDTPEMWAQIEKYGRAQLYTPGGMTTVFFFNDINNTPDVTIVGMEFDQKYEKYCIAGYWKYPNQSEEFQKFPFKTE